MIDWLFTGASAAINTNRALAHDFEVEGAEGATIPTFSRPEIEPTVRYADQSEQEVGTATQHMNPVILTATRNAAIMNFPLADVFLEVTDDGLRPTGLGWVAAACAAFVVYQGVK